MNKQEFLERGLEIILPYLTEEEFKEVKERLYQEFEKIKRKRFYKHQLYSLQVRPAYLIAGHFTWGINSALYWHRIYEAISSRFEETKKQKQICYN
jgi:hypothetical protein